LVALDAVADFVVEAWEWADDGDFGVGVEEVDDAAGGYLLSGCLSTLLSTLSNFFLQREGIAHREWDERLCAYLAAAHD